MMSKKQTIILYWKRLRLWLLEHPELNPYRFSVGLTLDPAWQEHPNKFSIGRAFQMATSSIRTLPNFIIIGSSKIRNMGHS